MSMSMGDRLEAVWYANRIGFGGVTLMATISVVFGIISNAMGKKTPDSGDVD